MKPEKKIRKICQNCKLYNPTEGVCGVTVVHAGEYFELKVKPHDRCWWTKMEQELAMLDGEDTEVPIREVRVQYDLENQKMKVETPNEENPWATI
jgi:hypothetical protein